VLVAIKKVSISLSNNHLVQVSHLADLYEMSPLTARYGICEDT